MSAATAPGGRSGERTRTWLGDAVRAGAAPAVCSAVLIGLLSAWVAAGGAGTVTAVRIQITLAAVPMRGFSTAAARAVTTAGTYLTIRNLAGTPDELVAVRSPVARHIVLRRGTGPADAGTVVPALAIPADAAVTLSPFGNDVVLIRPVPFESDGRVPLTLVFRHAGRVTVNAAVTAPGTP
ncbi:MAG TPA: copper chaperone PCu(A)C [Streptosporangiaceae bacterium]